MTLPVVCYICRWKSCVSLSGEHPVFLRWFNDLYSCTSINCFETSKQLQEDAQWCQPRIIDLLISWSHCTRDKKAAVLLWVPSFLWCLLLWFCWFFLGFLNFLPFVSCWIFFSNSSYFFVTYQFVDYALTYTSWLPYPRAWWHQISNSNFSAKITPQTKENVNKSTSKLTWDVHSIDDWVYMPRKALGGNWS